MARPPRPRPDPTGDAAALLRRLGFVVLFIGLPLAALLARRGPTVVLPLGTFLLAVAATLDGAIRPLRGSGAALLSSSGWVALAFAVGSAILSLAWAPSLDPAVPRLLALIGWFVLGIVAYLVVPERMRAANLYLVPIGCTLGALAIVVSVLTVGARRPGLEANGLSIERGACITLLLLWPALAWLRSRERDLEALTLAILAATATLLATSGTPIPLALGAGAVAYALVTLAPTVGASVIAAAMVLTLLLPVLFPLSGTTMSALLGERAAALAGLDVWARSAAIHLDRLLTGHGFSAHLAGRLDGSLPAGLSRALPIQLWYDLGLAGILASAAAIWFGLRGATQTYAPLLPGVAALYASAYTLGCLGVGIGQSWWVTGLLGVALAFVAGERGQYRTRRPRVRLFAAARAAT